MTKMNLCYARTLLRIASRIFVLLVLWSVKAPTAIAETLTAKTSNATEIGLARATLNGIISGTETETIYLYFKYGQPPDDKNRVGATPRSVQGPVRDVAARLKLTGLKCTTVYSFKIDARSPSDGAVGEPVEFKTAACTDGIKSSITASPMIVKADGVKSSTITVTLVDTNGAVIKNESVTLSAESGGSIGTVPANKTDDQGISSTSIKSDTVKTVTYSATSEADHVSIAGTVTVTFALPPSVETSSATLISSTGATLNGGVSSADLAPEVFFEYGKSISYGQSTPVARPGANHLKREFSASITDLECKTTYHFRAKAKNDVGSSNGDDKELTTADCSPQFSLTASPTQVFSDGASASILTAHLTSVSGGAQGKTITLAANKGSSTIAANSLTTDGNGYARFSVADKTPETVVYTASVTLDGVLYTSTASVSFLDKLLSVEDPKNTGKTNLFTKVAGHSFDLNVVATLTSKKEFTDTISVDVVSPSATDGCGTNSLGCTVTPSSYTYRETDKGKKGFTFNCAKAAPNVRVKVMSGTSTFCSGDNFAIRPASFKVSAAANADATGSSTNASPRFKAGTAFSLTATAVAGYANTPKIQKDWILVPDKPAETSATTSAWNQGLFTGSFPAADVDTGASSISDATYSEVGYFRFKPYAIYDDSFTAVDVNNATDCIATDDAKTEVIVENYSNTPDDNGKVGCYFGNTDATGYFGRFIPDHFTTTVTRGCLSSVKGGQSFTYSGQPFSVRVDALNKAGSVTKNYDSAGGKGFAKEVTLSDGTKKAETTTLPSGTLSNNTVAAAQFSAGSASTSTPTFAFTTSPSTPNTLQIRATESSDATVTSADFTEGTTPVRSGRIALYNATGSELLPLEIPVAVQQFSSANGWQSNPDDTCSTLAASNFAFNFSNSKLVACNTAISVAGNPPSQTLTLSAPGLAKTGSTTLTLNLGNSATGKTCTAIGNTGPVETPAMRPWLQFNWKGSGVTNPSARATFGVRRPGPILYLRERY